MGFIFVCIYLEIVLKNKHEYLCFDYIVSHVHIQKE